MVEAQHHVSTRKLVDSAEEHDALEALLEESKPKLAPDTELDGLHYLLKTPFRYPPLRHGSRFGTRQQHGIWYGSIARRTVLAEVAFYRLLFLTHSEAEISFVATEHTMYSARIATERGIDLTRGDFLEHLDSLTDRRSYAATHAAGTAMRELGVEAFVTRSARDDEGGDNVGVFVPRAFRTRTPEAEMQVWQCTTTTREVSFRRRAFLEQDLVVFSRAQLDVDGEIRAPSATTEHADQ